MYTIRRMLRIRALTHGSLCVGILLASIAGRTQGAAVLAPYVPSPPDVVARMLELAAVTSEDVVYDLGSGDGRIVIEAARRYGARGVGIELEPGLVARSVAAATAAGVLPLTRFEAGDVFAADVSAATVVTLYLLSASNARLRPFLLAQLAPGTRIVSHDFAMGDWEPAQVETFTASDGRSHTLYLWHVPTAP